MLTIVVDGGEMRSGVPAAVARLGARVDVAALPVADYLVADGIGVERKTVTDLHRSIDDGRLWAQLGVCRRSLDRTYLVVEGVDLDRGCISPTGVRGALLEIGDRGVTVVRSNDCEDSASWLVRMAVRAQRARGPGSRMPRRFRRARSAQVLLAEIPGIGPETARLLLERFGDVRGVADASEQLLTSVRGVGPGRAAALRTVLVASGTSPEEKCPVVRSVVESGLTGGVCVAGSGRAEPRHLRGSP